MTAPRPRLLSSSLWSLGASLAASGYQWGLVVALARMAEPAWVGRYALAAALASPPLMMAGLQLRTVIATDTASRFPLHCFWRLRGAATMAALGVVAALAAAAGLGGEAMGEVALVAAIRIVEQAGDLYHGILEKQEQLRTIAVAWLLRGAGSLAAFLVTWQWAGRLWPALAAVAAWQTAVLVWVERPAARRAGGLPHQEGASSALAELARRAVPLGMVTMLLSLQAAAPRYLIEARLGAEELGYFAALACLPLAVQTLAGAAAQAATVRQAAAWRSDRAEFRRLLSRLALGAAAVGIAGIAAAPWLSGLAGWLYRPEYASHPGLLAWLMVAGAVSSVTGVVGTSLTAAGVIGPQPAIYALSLTASTLYCLARLGPGREAAAAQALLAGAVVALVGQGWLLVKFAGRLPIPDRQGAVKTCDALL